MRTLLAPALVLLALVSPGCRSRDRGADTVACTPGESVVVGCTHAVGSPCSGDPALSVCDGTIAPRDCSSSNAIATNDDSDGLCPQVTTTCPASGRVSVAPRGVSGGNYACAWDVVQGGGAGNRLGATIACSAGETLQIGCTHTVGSPCTGDPVIEVCASSVTPSACTSTNAIARNDDSDGTCPLVTTTCPADGQVTVQPHAFSSGAMFTCAWAVLHSADAGPTGDAN